MGASARAAPGTILVDGKEAAKGRIEKTVLGRFSADETFDTGEDTGSAVSGLYEAPFRFGGTIKQTNIDLAPGKLGAVDEKTLMRAEVRVRLAE